MEFKVVASAIGIVLVIVYAVGSGIWVSTSPGWYTGLVKPSWQPPDFVFGLIWPYNFFVIGLAAVRISQKLSKSYTISWLIILALSIATALLWAYHFYVPHNLKFASFCLATTAFLTLPLLLIAFKASRLIGWLFLPYQLWVAIATTLAWGYASRN